MDKVLTPGEQNYQNIMVPLSSVLIGYVLITTAVTQNKIRRGFIDTVENVCVMISHYGITEFMLTLAGRLVLFPFMFFLSFLHLRNTLDIVQGS